MPRLLRGHRSLVPRHRLLLEPLEARQLPSVTVNPLVQTIYPTSPGVSGRYSTPTTADQTPSSNAGSPGTPVSASTDSTYEVPTQSSGGYLPSTYDSSTTQTDGNVYQRSDGTR